MQTVMVHLAFMGRRLAGRRKEIKRKRKEGGPRAAHFALEANIIQGRMIL
jgi:hypothetical protein